MKMGVFQVKNAETAGFRRAGKPEKPGCHGRSTGGFKQMRKALEGIRVIQLANFIAAAATGRYLADHGADVIIVEAAKGDPIRYTQEQEGRPQNIRENVAWE